MSGTDGMVRNLMVIACVALTVTGCARLAESRLNPLNWFGRSAEVSAPADRASIRPLVSDQQRARTAVADGRVRIAQVTELTIERTLSGAIIRATGQAPTQGYYNAELVLRGIEGSVLIYDFMAEAPAGFEATGSSPTRRITVAEELSEIDLIGISGIRVRAAGNAREARR